MQAVSVLAVLALGLPGCWFGGDQDYQDFLIRFCKGDAIVRSEVKKFLEGSPPKNSGDPVFNRLIDARGLMVNAASAMVEVDTEASRRMDDAVSALDEVTDASTQSQQSLEEAYERYKAASDRVTWCDSPSES